MQYSFGIIDWKISELKKLDTNTRKLLNMYKMLHPKADVERLYIPRKDGGRGLNDVETAFKTATMGLDHYLEHKELDQCSDQLTVLYMLIKTFTEARYIEVPLYSSQVKSESTLFRQSGPISHWLVSIGALRKLRLHDKNLKIKNYFN